MSFVITGDRLFTTEIGTAKSASVGVTTKTTTNLRRWPNVAEGHSIKNLREKVLWARKHARETREGFWVEETSNGFTAVQNPSFGAIVHCFPGGRIQQMITDQEMRLRYGGVLREERIDRG